MVTAVELPLFFRLLPSCLLFSCIILSVQMLPSAGVTYRHPGCASSQVSLLEYRKRQREARRSGSKTECSSPVSTVPPLSVDAFAVAIENTNEPPLPSAPTALSSNTTAAAATTTTVKDAQANEEAEGGEKEGEGQW